MKVVLASLVAMFLLSGCFTINSDFVRGSGNVVSEERSVSGFHAVDISGSGEAVIVQGSEEGLTIEMEDNLLPYMKSEVVNGVLRIGFEREDVLSSFRPTKPIKFQVRVKDLDSIDLSGAVNLTMDSLSTEKLSTNVSGAGTIRIDQLQADLLTADLSGATTVTLSGKVTEQKIQMSGSGNYRAEDLQTNITSIDASGASKVRIYAMDELKLNLSGASDVEYYGTPKLTQDVSGSADIKAMGDK
jgi:hypothetical protein